MPSSSTTDPVQGAQPNNICAYYNPYFGNGCLDGANCKYQHLKAKDYIAFCTRINKEHKADEQTRNTFRSAIDLLKKGQPQTAIIKFKEILSICPFDELYNMWCARCCEELNQYEDAEFYYRKSIAIQPKFATAHGRYAEFSWHKLGKIQQADIHFQKSLANKENHVTHRHYAQFLEQNFSDYGKSQFHFERCLQLSPKDHGAHHSYAIVLQKMGADVNRIKHHYETSIRLYDCANVQYSYALYLKNIRQNEAALIHLKNAIQFDARNAMYHFQCGQFMYHEMGGNPLRKQEGLNHIQNACALAPNEIMYKETLQKLRDFERSQLKMQRSQEIQESNEIISDNSGPPGIQRVSRVPRRGVLPERSCWGDRGGRNQALRDPSNGSNQINQQQRNQVIQSQKRAVSEFKENDQNRDDLGDQQITENLEMIQMTGIQRDCDSEQCESALSMDDQHRIQDRNQHQIQHQIQDQHQDRNGGNHQIHQFQEQEPREQREFVLQDPLCSQFQDCLSFENEEIQMEAPLKNQCQLEFERFVREKVADGGAGQEYIERFDEKQINDIRILEFVDYDFLQKEIGMQEMHIRMMLKKIDKFKRDMGAFTQWMHSLQLFDEYFEKLEKYGIITLDLFYEQIKRPQDLTDIIGKENAVDAMYLFHNTPKQCRHHAFQENQNCTR